MLVIALPMPLLLTGLSERSRCVGSPMETGAPIVSSAGITRYIKSIAQINDGSGNIIGWAYLTKGSNGDVIFVQLRKPLEAAQLGKAGLHWLPRNTISSLAPLGATWPWSDLIARKCSASTT